MTMRRTKSDDGIALIAMLGIMDITETLRQEPKPLPFGRGEHYRAYIPQRTPDDILEKETSAFWFGYAEALRELIEEIGKTSIVPFVEKRKKKHAPGH